MFGIVFVSFLWDLFWALDLSVCRLGELCLALLLAVFCGTYVGHWVFLFVGWGNYVGHCVCLFLWDLCWALGRSVCRLGELCLSLDWVIWNKHSDACIYLPPYKLDVLKITYFNKVL